MFATADCSANYKFEITLKKYINIATNNYVATCFLNVLFSQLRIEDRMCLLVLAAY